MALKGEAAVTQANDLIVRGEKEDGSRWTDPATLYLFVGDGPTCGDPPNTWKTTSQVIVGETSQYLVLRDLAHHEGGWAVGESKQFWVGKSEGTHRSWRATGTFVVTSSLGR